MSDEYTIEKGVTFVDLAENEFTVMDVSDGGFVRFDNFFPHYRDEIEGYLDDNLWRVKDVHD